MLVVLSEDDFVADRSFGNLPEVQTLLVGELNAYDILVNDWVVFTDETLPAAQGRPAVEIDVVEDADGNVVEVVETEVDVVVDAAGNVTEVVETGVDEVLGDDGEVVGVVETEVDLDGRRRRRGHRRHRDRGRRDRRRRRREQS